MKSFNRRAFSSVLFATVLVLGGCGGGEKEPDQTSVPDAADATVNFDGDSDSGRAGGLQTVQFPYDSHTLTSENQSILNRNAQLLKDNSSVNIQVEGHCDERGGIQYNIALGEKRANSVRKYLMDMGIPGNRISTISFGKEKPLDSRSNEEAWSRNRRGNFVITSR